MITQVQYKGKGSFDLIDEHGEIHVWFFRDIQRAKLKMKAYEPIGVLTLYTRENGVKFYEFFSTPFLTSQIRAIVTDITAHKDELEVCSKSQLNDLRGWGLLV
jgi:hypothetical protein